MKTTFRKMAGAAGASIKVLLVGFGLAVGLASGSSLAQGTTKGFPDKPVTIVVPFAAGGSTDVMTRVIAQRLGDVWKVPVIVESKPGAGGNIGAAYVARSAADGYTLLMGSIGTHAINPALYANMSYDPEKSFVPITRTVVVPNALVVPKSAPYSTVGELIAYAKANPGKLSFASSGYGSSLHMAGETFKALAGVDMMHVPFKGNGPATTALLGGQVSMIFDNLPSVLQNVRTGALKALAVTSLERSEQLPNVPTLEKELNTPGYEVVSWFGLWVPVGTPAGVVAKINKDVVAVLKDPQVDAQLRGLGAIPHPESSAEFAAFIHAEGKRWADVVRHANLTIQ